MKANLQTVDKAGLVRMRQSHFSLIIRIKSKTEAFPVFLSSTMLHFEIFAPEETLLDGNSLLIMDILVELEDGSLATDNIDDAELLIADYPWLAEIYEEIAEYMRKPKEVLTMFSDALKISDHNTVQYMIEEQAQQLVDKDTQLATMLLCQLFTIFYIFVHSGTHLILTIGLHTSFKPMQMETQSGFRETTSRSKHASRSRLVFPEMNVTL